MQGDGIKGDSIARFSDYNILLQHYRGILDFSLEFLNVIYIDLDFFNVSPYVCHFVIISYSQCIVSL